MVNYFSKTIGKTLNLGDKRMNKRLLRSLTLILFFFICSCQSYNQNEQNTVQDQSQRPTDQKKVVMIMIDSLMGATLDESINNGDIPALQYLIERGQYYQDLIVPFPSMSVTVESTLITGEMPDKHHIPGLSWFNKDEDRIVNYGTSLKFLLDNGLSQGIYDVMYNLNNEHLNQDVTTIYEQLEDQGFTSGSINMLLYRGHEQHKLTLPLLADKMAKLPRMIETKGPKSLTFGQFTRPNSLNGDPYTDGLLHRFGLRDRYSMEVTQSMIENGEQPDFLLVFFPDNDKEVHKHGPSYLEGLKDADQYLQDVLNSYGSWKKAIDENIFIIFGDHGQDQLLDNEDELAINLNDLAAPFHHADLGDPVSDGEIAFGVNQRMSYVYDVHDKGILPAITERALNDSRIDLIAWCDQNWINVMSPDHEKMLRFKSGGNWQDEYHQQWTVEGNSEVLSLQIDEDKQKLSYEDYPDVLHHISTALNSHDGTKLILAAKPGYSFLADGIETHEGGGEHGGLHKNDLLTALIITGTEKSPDSLRFVELKDYILELLSSTNE